MNLLTIKHEKSFYYLRFGILWINSILGG